MSKNDEILKHRVAALDWTRIHRELDGFGAARLGRVLDDAACAEISGLFEEDERFRSTIDMARHGYGQGAYLYFAYPLPEPVETLRRAVYPQAAEAANRWAGLLGEETRYPGDLDAMLARCHEAGQERPTPLLLRYREGDYNRLHQDLYGAVAFPLQLVVLLSAPGEEFEGGELVLTEQKPRSQSRAEVVTLAKGEAALFATSHRPAQGAKGVYRATLRHGVSRLRGGERFTLGVIFHDAG